MLSKHEKFSPSECRTKLVAECKDYGLAESLTCGLIDIAVPSGSNLSTSKFEEKINVLMKKVSYFELSNDY